jgi:hypothetical protein
MRRTIAGALALLVPAGCGQGSGSGGNQAAVATIRISSPDEDRLIALSEGSRNLALVRAIHDEGQRCKRVDAANRQQAYRGLSMWTARCSDSGDWAIFIAPDSSVQVRKCADLAELGLPQCKAMPKRAQG